MKIQAKKVTTEKFDVDVETSEIMDRLWKEVFIALNLKYDIKIKSKWKESQLIAPDTVGEENGKLFAIVFEGRDPRQEEILTEIPEKAWDDYNEARKSLHFITNLLS